MLPTHRPFIKTGSNVLTMSNFSIATFPQNRGEWFVVLKRLNLWRIRHSQTMSFLTSAVLSLLERKVLNLILRDRAVSFVLLSLALYHTVSSFNDPETESCKHRWKRRKCWSPAFSPFPTMFFYAFKERNDHFNNTELVVCICLQFGQGQKFDAW